MGLDVNLYADGTATDEELENANAFFSDREIQGTVQRDEYNDNRVEVYTLTRYYGPGYERGDWPAIHLMILGLRAAFPNLTVHYGSDSEIDCDVADDDALAAIWRHWLSPDWKAYRTRR